MQLNRVNNKEHLCSHGNWQYFWYVHALGFPVLLDWDILVAFTVISFTASMVLLGSTSSSIPLTSLPLSTVNSVWWVPVFPFLMVAYGLVSKIYSHGRGLPLGDSLCRCLRDLINLHLVIQLLIHLCLKMPEYLRLFYEHVLLRDILVPHYI